MSVVAGSPGTAETVDGAGGRGRGPVLVSDFDGTMTRRDFYLLVRERWWDETLPDPWRDYLAGRLSHFDALNRFFSRIRASEEELRSALAGMELDPGVPAALERLSAAGWRLVIASAGCEWYIRHLLAGVRCPVEIHANPGVFEPGRGLVMRLPEGSAFFDPRTGVDKVGVVSDALARHGRVVFAGDGPPDVAAALRVPAEGRYARGYLAEALRARGEGFQPLTGWEALAGRLLGGDA